MIYNIYLLYSHNILQDGVNLFSSVFYRFDRQSGAKLAEAVAQNRTLTELNVFANRIDSQAFLSICQALKDNDNLVTLKVYCTSVYS